MTTPLALALKDAGISTDALVRGRAAMSELLERADDLDRADARTLAAELRRLAADLGR